MDGELFAPGARVGSAPDSGVSARAPLRPRHRLVVVALAMAAAMALVSVLAPAPAHAASTWASTRIDCGGHRGSGQVDRAGNLYLACRSFGGVDRPHVQVLDAQAVRRQQVWLPAYATDVAPAPDGSALYLVVGNRVQKWVRQLTGAYVRDTAWRVDALPRWGSTYEATGEFIATDDAGALYFSTGTWTAAPNAVVKYGPDGRFVTAFGDWANSWGVGTFYWMNTGLAVTPDGASVYVAEVGNNRVQRFTRAADGSYTAAGIVVGNTIDDEDPYTGWCGDDVRAGRLAAPYDVGLDGAGLLYVLNTTCVQVKVFRAADGSHVDTAQFTSPRGGYVHGMAVDRAGRVYLPEIGVVASRTAAVGPAPTPQPVPVTDAYRGYAKLVGRDASGQWTWIHRWTPTGWQGRWVPAGTRVWTQPWGNGWMWTWHDGAWHAVLARDMVVSA